MIRTARVKLGLEWLLAHGDAAAREQLLPVVERFVKEVRMERKRREAVTAK